jgi:hypothetical protein
MNIKVADFIIRFNSDSSLYFDDGYLPYIIDSNEKPDIEVDCIAGIPSNLLEGCPVLFEAKTNSQSFYSVLKYENGLGFIIYDQQNINAIQQIAILDSDSRKWTIYSETVENGQLYTMKYPMGPILLYYLAVNNNAVMIHASGVFDGEKGRIFTGFSGTGKSTMAQQWLLSGSTIINDDRLIIRRINDNYFMYNTPMYYADKPKTAPVNEIHLIHHSPVNSTSLITGAIAVSRVMAFCIQNNYDKRLIQNYIDFISGLCQNADIYETGFLPELSIVKYLLEHER